MDNHQVKAVQESFSWITSNLPVLADRFYAHLFELDSNLRAMFPADMTQQKLKLLAMLSAIVDSLTRLSELIPTVQALGVRHVEYGVKAEHYDLVRGALLRALSDCLGEKFTPDVKAAWISLYTVLANTMLQAAELNEAGSTLEI